MIGQLCLFYLRLSGFSAYQRLFMPARAHLYQILQSNEQPLQKDSPPFFTREQLSDYVEKPPGRCLAQFMLEHCCRVQDKDISNQIWRLPWIGSEKTGFSSHSSSFLSPCTSSAAACTEAMVAIAATAKREVRKIMQVMKRTGIQEAMDAAEYSRWKLKLPYAE
jgi:hypothetical protein